MTSDERKIIAYLLANNMKTFKAESDGGMAATLLSRGIVIILARPNQMLDLQVPYWRFMRNRAERVKDDSCQFRPLYGLEFPILDHRPCPSHSA